METLRHFLQDDSGAAAVEYGLLMLLLALVCIGGMNSLGGKISTMFQTALTTFDR